MNNIILCGFMGCGKTTVGKKLAAKTDMQFIDMDKYIEERENMTVAEIFEKFGEERFREIESEVCVELAKKDNLVIASGGGTLTFQHNIDALKSTGRIVFLDVSYENLCERLRYDTKRPLLQVENRDEKIRELLDKRLPIYRSAASIMIDGNFSAGRVASNIIGILS